MNVMMKLDEDDRRIVADTIARIASDQFSIERCRSYEIVCDSTQWSTFAEHGVFAIGISPEHGGIGGCAVDHAMVMREIGLNLLPLPYLDTVVIGATLISRMGTAQQRDAILPAIASGDMRLCFAHREIDAGNLPDHVETRCQDGRLSGRKVMLLDGHLADKLVVTARDEKGSLGFYLVDREVPGLTVREYRLVDNRMASTATFEGVAAERIGGAEGVADGAGELAFVFDLAAVCLAAEAAGAAAGVNRITLDYAKTRHQFGRPIGSFQVIQHRLVDMFIAEQMADAVVSDALDTFDAGHHDPVLVAAAKAIADRSARQVAEASIQIHGGMGMTDECAAGHYLKRVLTIGSLYGTADWHAARVEKASLSPSIQMPRP